jgi:hypothetical protein
MSLKAGEVNTMLEFTIHALNKHGGGAKFGREFMNAGQSIRNFVRELKKGDVMPSPVQMENIIKFYDQHLRSCKASGISFSPKHHLAIHMVQRTRESTTFQVQPARPQVRLQTLSCFSNASPARVRGEEEGRHLHDRYKQDRFGSTTSEDVEGFLITGSRRTITAIKTNHSTNS